MDYLAIAVLAQEAEEQKNILLPAMGELIAGTLGFLVVMGFMARYAWPRIKQTLQERTDNIEGKLEQAERDRRQAEELLARRREQLDRARDEAADIVEEGRRRGEGARRDIITKAERDAERIIARGEETVAAERERAMAEVRQDVGQLAVQLAGRIIGENLNQQRQQALLDRVIGELTGSPLSSRDEGVRG
jgi:F-type H+-transporting ATPase subunit b